ncbi:MAG: MOSC domain-containing protein [Okeania sp. SIO2H7]|nr:MOSC domain-containing protein [Okeania sp. SIO2H7]
MSSIKVKQLFTYPIKGLTPHKSDRLSLSKGHGIKGDRAFALMFQDDSNSPPPDIVPWMAKKHFAVQNDWSGLAALDCNYDSQSRILTACHQGVELLRADTDSEMGRDRISAFFTGYLANLQPTEGARHPQKAPLRLVGDSSGETRYPDRQPVHISLLSQDTLDELSEVAGKIVDVRRFRPNIVLEGMAAWEEFKLVGKEFKLGTAKIDISARIGRCLNIEVNPETGDRDLPLFSILREKFGHAQTGVLATVDTDGVVAVGDRMEVI